MRESSNFPLRLPRHIKDSVMRIAKRDGTSANQFIAVAVAEKIGAIHAEDFFAKFSEGVDIEKARAILRRAGTQPPRPDDVMPPELVERMAKR